MTRAGSHIAGGRRLPGFSLLELLLVLVIVAILGAMAAPRYANSLWRYRADAAARRIASDFNLARSEARRVSSSRTVNIDIITGVLTISSVVSENGQSGTYTTNLRSHPYQARITSADLGGDFQLIYDGYGGPDSDGTLTVGAGDQVRTITIDGDTGKAEVQP